MRVVRLFGFAPALLAGAGWLASAQGALVNFNAAGDLAANFTTSAAPPFAEADAIGVGGSRGLQVTGTADSGATLQSPSFNFGGPGAKVQVSAYFHTATALGITGEDRVLELNLVGLNTNIPTGAHTGIGVKLEFPAADGDDILARFRQNNADVPSSLAAAAFDIQPGTWYKATFTATNQGAAAVIPSTVVLDSYGATGAALVTANVYSHSFDIPVAAPTLASDGQVFAAMRVRNGTRLYDAIDNFEAIQLAPPVPEPGTMAIAALAVCGIAVARRRA